MMIDQCAHCSLSTGGQHEADCPLAHTPIYNRKDWLYNGEDYLPNLKFRGPFLSDGTCGPDFTISTIPSPWNDNDDYLPKPVNYYPKWHIEEGYRRQMERMWD